MKRLSRCCWIISESARKWERQQNFSIFFPLSSFLPVSNQFKPLKLGRLKKRGKKEKRKKGKKKKEEKEKKRKGEKEEKEKKRKREKEEKGKRKKEKKGKENDLYFVQGEDPGTRLIFGIFVKERQRLKKTTPFLTWPYQTIDQHTFDCVQVFLHWKSRQEKVEKVEKVEKGKVEKLKKEKRKREKKKGKTSSHSFVFLSSFLLTLTVLIRVWISSQYWSSPSNFFLNINPPRPIPGSTWLA